MKCITTLARLTLVFLKLLVLSFLLLEETQVYCSPPTIEECPSQELHKEANDKQQHGVEESATDWKKILLVVCVISALLVLVYILLSYLDYDVDDGGSNASSDPSDQADLGPRLSPQLIDQIDGVRHSAEYRLFRTYLTRLLQISIDYGLLTGDEAQQQKERWNEALHRGFSEYDIDQLLYVYNTVKHLIERVYEQIGGRR